MRQTMTNRQDLESAPAVTPLCEAYPPRTACDGFGCSPSDTGVTWTPELVHRTEFEVRRELLSENGVSFDSLVVRRIPCGVCLQGYVAFDDQPHDLEEIARRVTGVEQVLNHLVVGESVGRIPR